MAVTQPLALDGHLAMHATGVPNQAPSRYPFYFFTLMSGSRYPSCMQNLFGMPCRRKWPTSRPLHTHTGPGYQVVDHCLVCQYGSDMSRSALFRTVTIFYGKHVRTNKDFGRMATSSPPYRHMETTPRVGTQQAHCDVRLRWVRPA